MGQLATPYNYTPLLLLLSCVMQFSCQSPQPEADQPAQDEFAKHIRTTKAKSPGDQLKSFKLPPGFRIELFASEPDIGKPMNISFDARGRLWVTQSQEYPFYDSTSSGADKILILEDTDNDGKADKFTTFADSLNIPIGIVPVPDGAIAFSIPYVYHMIDADGDDQADQRKILLSGFEYRDTHGMINNFFRGLDGWIHADHGYRNVSNVVGTDNNPPVVMNSGNTFRFRLDGTGVEFTTTGRVNPFGYAIDEFGYMYSADCHSSPIYQLIRGADYPHFGKQPIGIGFGPAMMPHNYASTALAGLEYYTGDRFPTEFQQNFYLGDVVKSRVYRTSIQMAGTTPAPTWEPDFIISEDPWFRPVDIKQGPDGALYIADFYNRIIGHYEVALDHPGRDRKRGRIWRITFDDYNQESQAFNWQSAELSELIQGLKNSSITVRMMVADQIVDRFGNTAVESIQSLVRNPVATQEQLIHGMWILHRLEKVDRDLIEAGLTHDNELIQTHMLRILFEMNSLDNELLQRIHGMTEDESPHIRRAAVMILARYPSNDKLETLLDLQQNTAIEDSHLAYAIKQATRDHLRNPGVLSSVVDRNWDHHQLTALSEAMLGVEEYRSAVFLAEHLENYIEEKTLLLRLVTHTARFIPEADINPYLSRLRKLTNTDQDLQLGMIESLQKGFSQRGSALPDTGREWAIELAGSFLAGSNSVGGNSELQNDGNETAVKRQAFACDIASSYKVKGFSPQLTNLLESQLTDSLVRTQAGQALLAISQDNLGKVAAVALDSAETEFVRERLLLSLIDQKTDQGIKLVGNELQNFSFQSQKRLVTSLCNQVRGIDQVLEAAQTLDIAPKMLLEPSIESILEANMTDEQHQIYQSITENLTPFSQETQALIDNRVTGYQAAQKSLEKGARVFDQHCGLCHQVNGVGGNIGPQLDGIGNRGLLALTEKILDPNRSISKAFVNYSITLKDGTNRQGLYRREEGNLKVYADIAGQEFSVSADDIVEQTALPFTLMPDNFSIAIPESDYYHMMRYLLDLK